MTRFACSAVLVTLVAIGGERLHAQTRDSLARESHLYDRFQLSAYGALLNLGTKLRVDGSTGRQGTELRLEEDLGSSRWIFEPAAAFRWRPGRRHELELGYLLARRSNEATLSRTISFADTSFTAGLLIGSSTKSDQASLNYRFAFLAGDRSQVGVGVGVGVLLLREELTTTGSLASGGAPITASYSASKSAYGPTASIGAYGRFYPGHHLQPHVELRAIRISIENFTGTVVEGGAALRWFVSPSWALEGGYTLGSYAVELKETVSSGRFLGSDFTGKITYTVNTFRAGVVFAF